MTLKSVLQTIFAVGSPAFLMGQVFPTEAHDSVFWDNQKVVLCKANNHNSATQVYKKLNGQAPLVIDPKYSEVEIADGKYWANNKFLLTLDPVNRIYSSDDGITWKQEGFFKRTKENYVRTIHYVRPGLFFMIAVSRFNLNGSYSRFALAKVNNAGELLIDQLLSMGLEDQYGIPLQKNADGTKGFSAAMGINEKYHALIISDVIVARTKDHLAVVHDRPGYVWLLNINRPSSPMRLVKLYPIVNEHKLGPNNKLEHAILDVQPKSNGKFLFASRSEDAVLFAASNSPKPNCVDDLKDPGFREKLSFMREVNLRDFPELQWFELNPNPGVFTEVPNPPGIPAKLKSAQEIKSFHFWFDEGGHVLSSLPKN